MRTVGGTTRHVVFCRAFTIECTGLDNIAWALVSCRRTARAFSPHTLVNALLAETPMLQSPTARSLRVALLAPAIALFAGCGGSDTPPTGTGGQPATPAPVASIVLSRSADTIAVATSRILRAELRAADGTVLNGRSVAWTSSQPGVATVSGGTVTGVAPGTTDITASSEGQSATARMVVTPVRAADVRLSRDNVSLTPGERLTVTATVLDISGAPLVGRTVTWRSDSPAIATVADGVITAVTAGTTRVWATTTDSATAGVNVFVTLAPVASVVVTPNIDSVDVGQSITFSAVMRDAAGNTLSGRTLHWRTLAPAIASVNANTGEVTAVSPGVTRVVALSESIEDTADVVVTTPFVVADGQRTIAPGFEQSCAIGTDGESYCWGDQRYGALGNGVTTDAVQTTAVRVQTTRRFVSLVGGYSHMCGLEANGIASCWGRSHLGQLGGGSSNAASTPQPVSGGLAFTLLASGSSDRTCGLTSAGAAWCWGSNANGALGTGTVGGSSAVPVAVSGAQNYRQLAAASASMCALRADGAAFCWGTAASGQLGFGSSSGTRSQPVPVQGNHQFVQIAGGSAHYCGRTTTGAVWCWGSNTFGQLGDGSTVNQLVPVRAHEGTTFASITAAAGTTCGLDSAGATFCWGSGAGGTLGNGNVSSLATNSSLAPFAVLGGLRFRELSALGSGTVCGKTLTNRMYCWGSGVFGTIGDGARSDRGVPTAVVGMP